MFARMQAIFNLENSTLDQMDYPIFIVSICLEIN